MEGFSIFFRLLLLQGRANLSGSWRFELDSITQSPSILIVDDEPAILKITARILEKAGWKTELVHSGTEAIRAFDAPGAQFDVVLLDLILPDAEAGDLVARFRDAAPDTRIILMSGQPEAQAMESLGEIGIFGFIQKPFRRPELVRIVRTALGEEPGG